MKKIKFPLILKDEVPVRTIEELRKNFDLNKITNYFLNGKLLAWLEVRYYEKEAIAVKALKKDEAQLHQKLCSIFGVEYTEQDAPLDMEEVEARNTRLARLKQYTSDETILSNVDHVAFDQEELSNLFDENVHDIYLCSNSFSIPLKFENRKYIGIGKVEAVINSSERVDFNSIGIEFENVQFDIEYEKLRKETPKEWLQKGLSAEESRDYITAIGYYRKAADAWERLGFFKLGWFYSNGYGVEKDGAEAYKWYKKAADMGDSMAMNNIGWLYDSGIGLEKNAKEAHSWYRKAAELGNSNAMYNIANLYNSRIWEHEIHYEALMNLTIQWYTKAANAGNVSAMLCLAEYYTEKKSNMFFPSTSGAVVYGIERQYVPKYFIRYDSPPVKINFFRFNDHRNEGVMWYKKAADLGNKQALFTLATLKYGTRIERRKWAEKAIQLGDINSLYTAMCLYRYYDDYGNQSQNTNDIETAAKLYKKYIEYLESHNNVDYVQSPNIESLKWDLSSFWLPLD